MDAKGRVHKYQDNVDTDVIIPARYLNTKDHAELASHCMEDIDPDFVKNVKPGDIIVAGENFGCGSSRKLRNSNHFCEDLLPQRHKHRAPYSGVSGSEQRN